MFDQHPRRKILLAVFILLIAAPLLLARFDLSGIDAFLAYTCIISSLFIIAYISYLNGSSRLIIFMASSWGLAIIIATNMPLPIGHLFDYDQHATLYLVRRIVNFGQLPEPVSSTIRASNKIGSVPVLYVLVSIISLTTGLSEYATVLIFPAMIIVGLPVIGYALVKRERWIGALLWTAPATGSLIGAVGQVLALPLLGTILLILNRQRTIRLLHILPVFALALAITHTLTAVISIITLIGYIATSHLIKPGREGHGLMYLFSLFSVVIVSSWIIIDNKLILGKIATLIAAVFVDPSYLLGEPIIIPEALSQGIPVPNRFWVGLFLRFIAFCLVGYCTMWIMAKTNSKSKNIMEPSVLIMPIVGIFLAFITLLQVVSMGRNLILLSIFLAGALPIVFDLIKNPEPKPSEFEILSIIGVSISSAIVLTMSYHQLSSESEQPVYRLLIISTVSSTVVLYGISKYRGSVGRWFSGEGRLDRILITAIVFLLAGNLLFTGMGVGPATFSVSDRDAAFEEPGLPKYHKSWDYATARFHSKYTAAPLVGDVRIWLLEIYFRQEVENKYQCYMQRCEYEYIAWFNSYTSIWQSIEDYGTAYTSFKNPSHLSHSRNKVYTSGNSSIYH